MRERNNWDGMDSNFNAWIIINDCSRHQFPKEVFEAEFQTWKDDLVVSLEAEIDEEEARNAEEIGDVKEPEDVAQSEVAEMMVKGL